MYLDDDLLGGSITMEKHIGTLDYEYSFYNETSNLTQVENI